MLTSCNLSYRCNCLRTANVDIRRFHKNELLIVVCFVSNLLYFSVNRAHRCGSLTAEIDARQRFYNDLLRRRQNDS